MCKLWITTFFVLLMAGFSAANADQTIKDKSQLTVWLIPFDPPFETTWAEDQMPIKKQLDSFNRRWRASNITVLNTTVDWMVDQLVVWNPEYDLPNWTLIRGQEKTLETLSQFSKINNTHLHIRFLTWKTLMSALEKVLGSRWEDTSEEENSIPDVVQIGSTWAAYFAEKKISRSPVKPYEAFSWREINNVPVSLPYTIDVRLMFYWKKMPGGSKPFRETLKNASDWQGIIDALSTLVLDHQNPAPPMVMPTGLTFNLFHDFVPLVWASGEPFFVETPFGTRTDMGKRASLKIPLLISQNATTLNKNGRAYRIISFPEMSQESAAFHFMKGLEYVAIIQPAAFLSRWRQNFMKTVSASPEAFWDYAGVRLLPSMFKGGTDLMVVNGTKKHKMAFQLVHFLASDHKHSGIAAENGYLPAQHRDFGLSVLLDTLGGPACKDAKTAISLIHTAIEKGREYPPIPQLPTRVEPIEVLEAMQMLWRRIGEGNVERAQKTAEEVALIINSRIYWPSSLWVLVKKLWPAIAFLLALSFFGLYLQSRKIAWRNRLLRIAVDSLRRRDYVLVSRAGAFVSDCRQASEQACEDFSKHLHDLRTRTLRLEENIRKDLEHSGRRSFPVSILIHEAWENAASQYRIAYPSAGVQPRKPILKDGLDHLQIRQMPYVLVAILQDWFYNSMKNDLYESDHIEVRLWREKRKNHGLAIHSRYSGNDPISDQPFGPLPKRVFDLMCEQSKAAYGRIPIIKGIEMAGGTHSTRHYTAIFLPAPVIE
jgi:hypothetical protein